MAKKEQYEVFKSFYDEENERLGSLTVKGNVYLSITTLYLGVLILKVSQEQIAEPLTGLPLILLTAVIIFFLLSLCWIVVALGVYNYERLTDPEKIIEESGTSPPINDDFFDDRIVDLAVATNRNFQKNNKRADCLRIASILLVAGIVTHISMVGYQTWERIIHEQHKEGSTKEESHKEEAGGLPGTNASKIGEAEILKGDDGSKEDGKKKDGKEEVVDGTQQFPPAYSSKAADGLTGYDED